MKKIKTLIIAIILAFILTGCLGPVIIKIAPEKAMIELEVGDFVRVEFDSNHTGPFEFITSDEDIFTVEDGIIYGVSVGLAFLTIEAKETPSNIEAKANIAIKVVEATSSIDEEDVETEVKEITIIGNQNLKVGESEIFRANYGDSTYLNDDIIWMSQNSEVASIDANGILTANQAGTTTIIVIIDNQTATIVVNVRTDGAVVVKPTSLIINGSSFVNVSDSVILTVTPNQGNITGITWTSSDNSKATVNEFGIVTGVATGIVTITATLTDDTSVSNTFTLVVKESETSASPITSINLSGANEVLQGNKIKLNVTYTPANEPATFTYASSNTSVAIVDAAGWVTGVSGGVVQITASLVGDPEKKANFTVTVIPLPTGITISGASTVSYGQNIILTATAIPTGATNIVTWTSSDSTVVTIDVNGRVTGMKVGTATITATSIVSASIKATHQVTVTDQMSITLNPTSLNLVAGSNQTLTATVVAASLTDKSVSWSSSNTSVATVDSNGKVTAVAAGSANIIAKLNANNSIQAQASVTVTAPSLPTISLSNNTLSLVVGDTKTLTATVGNTSNTSVTWSSSATSIATVDSNGKVTAVKAGTATITATSVADTSVKATCTITVTNPPAGTLTITADPSANVPVGGSGYQIYVRDSGGTSVSRLECVFTSSDSSVATVSTYGTISALKDGTVTITVTHPSKGSGTITLTIGTGGSNPPGGTMPAATGTSSLVFASPGANASSQMNISWHHTTSGGYLEYTKKSDTTYANKVQVAPSSTSASFVSTSDGNSQGYNGTVSYFRKLVNITGLTANTEYRYRIIGSSASSDYYFKTASTTTFSFIYMSDVHAYPALSSRLSTANSLVSRAESKVSGLSFVLFTGDLTAHGSDYYQWKHLATAPFAKNYFLASVPGNHDYYKAQGSVYPEHTSDVYYNAMFNNPKNGASGISNSSYYFKYNNVLFVGINSEVLDTTRRNAQKSWLSTVINNNPSDFVIAFSHREFFHGSTASAPSGVAKSSDCYNIYGSTLESLGVDLVLSGDDHVYVRSKPIKNGAVSTASVGTVYITANQIGARGRIATAASSYSAKVYGGSTNNNDISTISTITVSSTQITGQMFNASGTVLDTYSIPKK